MTSDNARFIYFCLFVIGVIGATTVPLPFSLVLWLLAAIGLVGSSIPSLGAVFFYYSTSTLFLLLAAIALHTFYR